MSNIGICFNWDVEMSNSHELEDLTRFIFFEMFGISFDPKINVNILSQDKFQERLRVLFNRNLRSNYDLILDENTKTKYSFDDFLKTQNFPASIAFYDTYDDSAYLLLDHILKNDSKSPKSKFAQLTIHELCHAVINKATKSPQNSFYHVRKHLVGSSREVEDICLDAQKVVCLYLIDQNKTRLSDFKKEFYNSGSGLIKVTSEKFVSDYTKRLRNDFINKLKN